MTSKVEIRVKDGDSLKDERVYASFGFEFLELFGEPGSGLGVREVDQGKVVVDL